MIDAIQNSAFLTDLFTMILAVLMVHAPISIFNFFCNKSEKCKSLNKMHDIEQAEKIYYKELKNQLDEFRSEWIKEARRIERKLKQNENQ
jgi:predicted membrane protein